MATKSDPPAATPPSDDASPDAPKPADSPAVSAAPLPAVAAAPPRPAFLTPALEAVLAKVLTVVKFHDAALKVVEEANRLGLDDLDGASFVDESTWKQCGVKQIQAAQLVAAFKAAPTVRVEEAGAAGPFVTSGDSVPTMSSILPTFLDGDALTQALVAGGFAKVSEAHVVAALRVHSAHRAGMFNIADRLESEMKIRLQKLREPAPPVYMQVRKTLRRRKYADILEAMDTVGGGDISVTNEDRQDLLRATQGVLIPAVKSFIDKATSWCDSIIKTASLGAATAMPALLAGGGMFNPAAMAIISARSRPDTTILRNAVRDFNDAANETFAGLGIPVAVTLVQQARVFAALLDDPAVRSIMGAASKEELLEQLELTGSLEDMQNETAIAHLGQCIMAFPTRVPQGSQMEGVYIAEMVGVAQSITWDKVLAPADPRRPNGSGGRKADPSPSRGPFSDEPAVKRY